MIKREEKYISKVNDTFCELVQEITTTDEIDYEYKEDILVSMKESLEDEIRRMRSCE